MLNNSLIKFAGSVMILIAVVGCEKHEETKSVDTSKSTTPIIPVTQLNDWCPEHGVPESICTRCNKSLVAGFKAKNDWDEQHGLPKSQCFQCDPSLKEKFVAAFATKYGKQPPTGGHH